MNIKKALALSRCFFIPIKNPVSQAFQWGADIINGIVNDIKNCIGKVADAVKGVANIIKSFLHFSVLDEGPLADFESWMPDFMKGLAKDINKSKKYVEAAASGCGSPQSEPLFFCPF